jgi:hypothetical protein
MNDLYDMGPRKAVDLHNIIDFDTVRGFECGKLKRTQGVIGISSEFHFILHDQTYIMNISYSQVL